MPQWSPIPQTHQVNLGQPRASSAVKSTKVYSVFHFFFFRIRSPHFPGFETMETHFSAENLFIFFSFVDWWSENLKLFREFVLFSSVKCKHLHLFLNFLYFQYHEESVDVVLGFEKEFVKASASLTRPDGVPTPLAISLSMSLRNANECNMQQQQMFATDNVKFYLIKFHQIISLGVWCILQNWRGFDLSLCCCGISHIIITHLKPLFKASIQGRIIK